MSYVIASPMSSLSCFPARMLSYETSENMSKTHPDQGSENATFRRHLTMAVFDLAETSSVLGIFRRQVTFELADCCAFGGCPWFHMKPSVSTPAMAIWPSWFSRLCVWVAG
jgi:hypothetical protein